MSLGLMSSRVLSTRAAESLGIDLLSIKDLEEQIAEIRMGYFTNSLSTRMTKKRLVAQPIVRGYRRSDIAKRLGVSRKTVYNLLAADFNGRTNLGDRTAKAARVSIPSLLGFG